MRGWKILGLSLFVLFAGGETSAAAAQPSELSVEVATLVRELDADTLSARDNAEKKLVELGIGVVELLPAVTPRMSGETAVRLQRIRTALEMEVAIAAARSTLVTLKGTMRLRDAFAAVAEQTGNKIAGTTDLAGETTVAFDRTPFWEVLDKLLDEAKLETDPYGDGDGGLVTAPRPENQLDRFGNAAYSGVFRLEAKRLESARELRSPGNNFLRLALNVSWEPRVMPIIIRQARDAIRAVDGDGSRLEVNPSRAAFSASPADHRVPEVELIIPFALPARHAVKIASLQGTFTAVIPGSQVAFEFDDIASLRNVQKRIAGVTITFEQLRRNGDLHELRMRARYDEAAEAMESNRRWVYANEAYLIDLEGERVEPIGRSGNNSGENEVRLSFLFALPGSPEGYRFVYRTPSAVLRVPVEYELTDIPLP